MLNWLKKKKNKEEKSIISSHAVAEIYNYLYYLDSAFRFELDGYAEKVYVNLYTFPTSISKKELKKSGYINSIDLLNELFKKSGIETVETDIGEDECYPFIQVELSKFINKKEYTTHFFFIYFLNDEELFIAHSTSDFHNFVKAFLTYKEIDFSAKDSETQELKSDIEKMLYGCFQCLQIPVPDGYAKNPYNISIKNTVSEEETTEFLNIISRNNYDKNNDQEETYSHLLFAIRNDEAFEFIEENDVIRDYLWNIDWRIDFEDFSDMLADEFSFPLDLNTDEEQENETFLAEVQKSLNKHNIKMINFVTDSDNYLLGFVKSNEVEKISALCDKFNVEIEFLIDED